MSDTQSIDPLIQTAIQDYERFTRDIQRLRDQQVAIENDRNQRIQAVYHGLAGDAKVRLVRMLVEVEQEHEPHGAKARIATILGLSPGRITQLLK